MAKKAKKTTEKKARSSKSFPNSTFEDVLVIPATILNNAGNAGKIRRLTLFEHLNRSPDSGPSRMLVINSGKYGLTTGGYQADFLELTPDGKAAVDPEIHPKDQLRARFKLAVENIPPFNFLFERFKGSKLPSQAVMKDALVEVGVSKEHLSECVDIFITNIQHMGLIRTLSGTERLLTLDHALDSLSDSHSSEVMHMPAPSRPVVVGTSSGNDRDWSKSCFYISPIGDESSEERKHSNLLLGSFVEPAMEKLGLEVIRADQIGQPGMITSQIIEHIKKCRLVIADLSYLNPNVFYEVGLRHSLRLPSVQIIRKQDKLPFDVGQVRTITIDMSDIYTLVPKIEVYISDISTQSRAAMENPDFVGNPISIFYPSFYERDQRDLHGTIVRASDE